MIGLDWGTSNLRAWRMDATGRVCEARSRAWGIRQLPEGGFDAALVDLVAARPRTLPLLACGMVGSREGWCEAPYIDIPADTSMLGQALTRIDSAGGRPVHIVRGLRNTADPDVMRGEETQLVGGLQLHPQTGACSTWILPGTHSKWVTVRHDAVTDFHTVMTGELFELLSRHSIIGQARRGASVDAAAFADGARRVRDSRQAGAMACLFGIRARMLDGTMTADAGAEYLSGVLIGEEIRSMLANGRFDMSRGAWLVGEPRLCERYRCALACFDIHIAGVVSGATARGLWYLACAAGLVGRAGEDDDAQTLA